MKKGEAQWEDILKAIRNHTTAMSYKTWFADLIYLGIDSHRKIIYVQVQDNYIATILNQRYKPFMSETATKVMLEPYTVEPLHFQ